MPAIELRERCVCGAMFEYVVSDGLISHGLKAIAEFRNEHKHEEAQPNQPSSTVAKGDFGYVRYAQGSIYEDDDDEEE